MNTQRQTINKYATWHILLLLLITSLGSIQQANAAFGTPTRYEAETSNLGNVSTSSTNAGYSGSGYVTGLTSEWSYISFDKSNPSTTTAKLDIRYANGTGAAVNNLALYVGSTKIQNLSFPTTTNWATWATLSITFTLEAGYQGIKIDGETNASSSVNIDYSELSLDDGTGTSTVATPTFNPAAGTYTSAQSVAISTTTSGAIIYYTTDGTTPTTSSTVYASAINVGSNQTIKALATKSGSTNSAVGSAAYTINIASTVATPTFSPAAGTYTSAQSVTISTSTSGATIYYTTDGSTPTTSSSVYSSAISVGSTQTLKAVAAKSGSTTSAVGSAAYTINTSTPVVDTPTFSPAAGTYTSAQSITISTTTSGATIYYTTDGSTPTTSSSVYSSAISVGSTQTLKALATKSSFTNSSVATAAYTISTGGGTETGNITREYWAGISGTSVTDLTSNASYPNSPTSTSLLSSFESPTNVADNYGQRVKGYVTAPTTGSYTFWIAADDGAELWLSTTTSASNKVKIASVSGWTSSQEWTKYSEQTSASITLTAGTQYYIEALHKEGSGGDNLAVAWQVPGSSRVVIPGSALSTTINGGTTPTAATPTFSPVGGTYTSAQTVAISTATSGASIRYTTDGTAPTASSTLYSSAIIVSSTQTLKAIAIASGYNNSVVGSATYTINTTTPTAATPTFNPAGGTYTSAQTVTISSTTTGASIRYTTNGSDPTASSTLYSGPIAVSATQTVKAIAIATGFDNSAIGTAAYTINTGGGTNPTQNITRQFWSGISGTAVTSLTNNVNYPNNPTSTSTIASFQVASQGVSNYGQRVKGYLVPSVTGSYQFAIASDDESELWLSTNDFASNKVKIANVPGWTNEIQYDKYPVQVSASISLTAGTYYYVEALHKNADGGDHLSVAWKTPGSGSWVIIPSANLSTQPANPLPAPTAFNQTAPASVATNVSRVPTFTWGASTNASSYTLVVANNSSYTSPVVNQGGITGTSYTMSSPLSTSTLYYWKVTAVGEGGTKLATNANISFTTEAQPLPGSFSQLEPASSATGTSLNPAFSWGSSVDATDYTIVIATNSAFTSPVVNTTVNGTNYSPSTPLAVSTTYYWKVSANNSSGSRQATNAGISFTTGATGNTYYISTTGVDASNRDGSQGNPWKTLAYAATRVTAGKTIYINAGTYTETQPTILPIGVNITGAGEATTIIKAGNIGTGSGDEDFTGSLIQLISPSYVVDMFSAAIAPANGNQAISGFTIDGTGKTLKAGIWLQARNNVTINNITVKDCAQRGVVACFGTKKSKEEPPYYITGLKIYNMTFTNSGVDLSNQSLGNLNIGHTDGADIYNITINDIYGYGIKFIFEGYYKNTKIHDCNISVNENDPLWTEDIAMEMWNLGPGNEIYNVNCNTWLSFVNWANTFNNPTAAGSHLKVHDCKIIDLDGASLKEGIEAACSGLEVYNCYFENKGWGIAQWLQGERKMTYRNNIFRNTQTQAVWADAGAIFIVADEVPKMQDIKIYNNVFDNLRTGGGSPLKVVSVWKGTVEGLDVANNVSTNMLAETFDLFLYSGTTVTGAKYRNNVKDIAHNVVGNGNTITQSANVVGTPGYKATGQRWDTYYQPASATSFMVDKGVDVGLPFSGAAPDAGRWERGLTSNRTITSNVAEEVTLDDDVISAHPNPTTGIVNIKSSPDVTVLGVQVMNTQGKVLLSKAAGELKSGQIDLSSFNNDLYILKVKHQRGVITRKIILLK